MLNNGIRVARAFSTKNRVLNEPVKSLPEVKYADKLKAKMEEKGVDTLDKLRALLPKLKDEPVGTPRRARISSPPQISLLHRSISKPDRRDSSPIKPLSSFLNTSRIMQSPHTAEHISSLWLIYHGSRSNGTGRGYLSASMTRPQYEAMLARALRYPVFVLPLSRKLAAEEADSTRSQADTTEFYFMQWDFYDRAEAPSHVDPSSIEVISPRPQMGRSLLPHNSSVILTPLEEYKLRGTYAQPRLVITHYPDFAGTHNVVLLRGEIAKSDSGNFLLSQIDAQILALTLQKFYLPSESATSQNTFELLRTFHEAPDAFDYQRLMDATIHI